MVKRSALLKFTAFVKRKEGISFEEFDNHWTNNHGPLLASLPIFKEKLIRYKQVHINPMLTNALLAKGYPVLNAFDGMMEAYAENLENFMALLESEEYKTIVIPDEDLFVDREKSKFFFGYEEVHWELSTPESS